MNHIDAREIVASGFPTDEGARLAHHILEKHRDKLDKIVVSLRGLPPALLISAFFNAFLQHIADKAPELLGAARALKWELAFDFQAENVQRWMRDFKPFVQRKAAP